MEAFLIRRRKEAVDRISWAAASAQSEVERMATAAQSGVTAARTGASEQISAAAAAVSAAAASAQSEVERMTIAAQSGVTAARAGGAGRASSSAHSLVASAATETRQLLCALPRADKGLPSPWGAFRCPAAKITRAAGEVPSTTRTKPPIRLRMKSCDQFAQRSMEVEWEHGTAERQRWSSYNDPLCGWFEAERVLPASVTNVSVWFRTHAVVKSIDVSEVDRHDSCRWVTDEHGDRIPEVFTFSSADSDSAPALDITFELRGLPGDCHIWRAWNSARESWESPEPWESWDDEDSRPIRAQPLEVLQMADTVELSAQTAPGVAEDGDPFHDCDRAARRLVAAAKTLQELRRQTLAHLRDLDQQLTGQWLAVNSTNTVGAGLAVASAVSFFVAPPVGIGLGLASAAAGGAATAGDAVADHLAVAELRRYLCDDEMSAFAVMDLQRDWMQARDRAGAALTASGKSSEAINFEELGHYGRHALQVGLAVAEFAVVASEPAAAATALTAQGLSVGARVAPVATKVLGIAGAVVSTGVAVHGWATTKTVQATARQKYQEISSSMLGTQRWLAAMLELECPICLGGIDLSEEARCCRDSWHFSHRRCIDQWAEECRSGGRETTCPLCCGPLAPDAGILEDLILADMQSLACPSA